MKFICIISLFFLGFNSNAQSFSFLDTVTVLIKTTDESPAHWYLEVVNEVLVDTTLRWKVHFGQNLPSQWVISFDDQDNFYFPVNDGDSADFTLMAMPISPQKLIIGATLNNTAGNASVYFDVYDPADPSFVQTIEYHFVVSMGSGTWGTEELTDEEQWFAQSERTFTFSEEFNSNEVSFYAASGKRVYTSHIDAKTVNVPSTITSGVYYVRMQSGNTFYSSRIVLN